MNWGIGSKTSFDTAKAARATHTHRQTVIGNLMEFQPHPPPTTTTTQRTQRTKTKQLPRSSTFHKGKKTKLSALRSTKFQIHEIQLTRIESKEERFARLRQDLLLLRCATCLVQLVEMGSVLWVLQEVIAKAMFGAQLSLLFYSACGYMLWSTLVGLAGAYLCYRTVITVHVAMNVVLVVLLCVAATITVQLGTELDIALNSSSSSASSLLASSAGSRGSLGSAGWNGTTTPSSSSSLFSGQEEEEVSMVSSLSLFLLTEMKHGYQAGPIQMETSKTCCGWTSQRNDCAGDLGNSNVSTVPAFNVSTCSSIVVTELIATMNESDEIAYMLFILLMNLVLTVSLLIGANSNKYKVDIDALKIISKIEQKGHNHADAIRIIQGKSFVSGIGLLYFNRCMTDMTYLFVAFCCLLQKGFYRRWKAKNMVKRRMYYLLWAKDSKKRRQMSLVVYVLACLYSVFMIFVILIYGIKFEQEVAVEWLVMCGWATFLDIFVQQPLR